MKRVHLLSVGCALLGVFLFGTSARAAGIPVTNYSFEADGMVCCGNVTSLTGWTLSDGNSADGTQNQSNPPDGPGTTGGQGSYWAFVNLDGAGQTGTITTTSAPTTIAPNTTYTVTIALGNNAQGGGYGEPGNDFISILAGSTAISTTAVPEGSIPNNSFVDHTVTYTSGANSTLDPNVGQPLNIQMGSTVPDGAGVSAHF